MLFACPSCYNFFAIGLCYFLVLLFHKMIHPVKQKVFLIWHNIGRYLTRRLATANALHHARRIIIKPLHHYVVFLPLSNPSNQTDFLYTCQPIGTENLYLLYLTWKKIPKNCYIFAFLSFGNKSVIILLVLSPSPD